MLWYDRPSHYLVPSVKHHDDTSYSKQYVGFFDLTPWHSSSRRFRCALGLILYFPRQRCFSRGDSRAQQISHDVTLATTATYSKLRILHFEIFNCHRFDKYQDLTCYLSSFKCLSNPLKASANFVFISNLIEIQR